MATVERFEDLVVWQKARELTKAIYAATRQTPFTRDFGLKDQIQRASVSIMSNVAEGFERRNPAEFFQFLSVARGSCAEVRSQLYIALDVAYLTKERFDRLIQQTAEIGRLLGGLQAYIEGCKARKATRRPPPTRN